MRKALALLLCFVIVFTGVGGKSSSRHTTDGSKKVYVTETGTKYHKKSCKHAKNADAIRLDDAVDFGYEPCKTCKPPILDTADDDKTVTYVLNKSTKKFHYPWCSYAKKISAKNYEETSKSASQLKKAGYSACGHCKP